MDTKDMLLVIEGLKMELASIFHHVEGRDDHESVLEAVVEYVYKLEKKIRELESQLKDR